MENLELVMQKLDELKDLMSAKITEGNGEEAVAKDDMHAEGGVDNESEIEQAEVENPVSEVTEENVDNSESESDGSGNFESEEEMREYLRGPKKEEKKKKPGVAFMLAVKGKK